MTSYPAFARDLARRYAPGLMADRARRYEREFRERHGVTELVRQLIGDGPATVRQGPFQGMTYPTDRLADVDAPAAKLLGTYEREIYPPLVDALNRGLETFIDVGCADGYYAVGMTCAGPRVTTHAFDLSQSARDLCLEVARVNGLASRVHIRRRFSRASLDRIDATDALLLCDIEGAESRLFDAALVERLRLTTVLIEVHEETNPALSAHLAAAFAPSHSIERIEQEPRKVVGGLPPVATAEFRPHGQHWLLCRPLADADSFR
jgi:precorrin-6B methylase 2